MRGWGWRVRRREKRKGVSFVGCEGGGGCVWGGEMNVMVLVEGLPCGCGRARVCTVHIRTCLPGFFCHS